MGETGRTDGTAVGLRIKEHLKTNKQTVYEHLKSHNVNLQEGIHITWEIIHNNIKHCNERKTIEAIEIQVLSASDEWLYTGCLKKNEKH